jgi:Photosynthetic reaction centre cytochrome C subunit
MRKTIFIALAVLFALPLLGEQKNVKELTGLSDFQLVRAMQEMADGLGVQCAFCHVEKDKELDFPADDKEEKQRAREMIAMVKAANISTFKGRSTLSCYTCHKGKNNVTGLVPLPVAPPAAEEHQERPKGLPTAADIVKKYADAAGDVSRWESFRAKGVRESQDGKTPPIPFELEWSHGRFHVTGETPRGKMEQTVGATHGWVKAPEPHDMNAHELDLSRDQAAAYQPTDPKDISTDPKASRVAGKEKIGDHDTYILFTSGGQKARQRLYFDATSGLLVRKVVLTDSPVGTIPSQTDFDEWKDAGGTKFPFVVKWSSVDWRNSATRKYSDVTLAAKIEEKAFDK